MMRSKFEYGFSDVKRVENPRQPSLVRRWVMYWYVFRTRSTSWVGARANGARRGHGDSWPTGSLRNSKPDPEFATKHLMEKLVEWVAMRRPNPPTDVEPSDLVKSGFCRGIHPSQRDPRGRVDLGQVGGRQGATTVREASNDAVPPPEFIYVHEVSGALMNGVHEFQVQCHLRKFLEDFSQ